LSTGERGKAVSESTRLFDGGKQLLHADRLFEKADGADLGRLHGGIDGGVARHHHDRHGELAVGCPFLEQRDAIGIRHPDVEQHQIGPHGVAPGACRSGILGGHDIMTLVGEDFGKKLANADFVVDDQYL
jgi:hypothetical protein